MIIFKDYVLTKTQKEYFQSLSQDELSRAITIKAWNPECLEIANILISDIEKCTGEKVLHMGSSALGIAGEKDIDLFLFTKNAHPDLISRISRLLMCEPENLKWKFIKNGFKITLKVANPEEQKRKDQLLFFEVLKSNQLLRNKYELIKLENRASFGEYILAKMDFVTRVVNIFYEENQKRINYLIKNQCAIDSSHVFINESLHTSQSFDICRFLKTEKVVDRVMDQLSCNFNKDFDVVVGIPRNGDILGEKVARKKNKIFISSNDIVSDFLSGKRVLIIDDTVVTGKTIIRIAENIKKVGGIVIGAAVICCRKNIPQHFFQNEIFQFVTYIIQDDTLFGYEAQDCPYCRANKPFSEKFGFI